MSTEVVQAILSEQSQLLNQFLRRAVEAAIACRHPFAEYVACEAALESDWGRSELARYANNLFGQKGGFTTAEFPYIDMSTKEVIRGQWSKVKHCWWPKYTDWGTCFREHLELLVKARHSSEQKGSCPKCGGQPGSPMYQLALTAATGENYVNLVSVHWATDPQRASKVLSIHRHHFESAVGR